MDFKEVFDLFVKDAPAPAMVRATLENCFSATEVDRIFAENAEAQRENELLFSTVVGILQLTVLHGQKAVNSAYEQKQEEVGVSVNSVYNKLAGVELNVTRALVRETAARKMAIVEQLGGKRETLPGYRVKIADGKHLDRTERRLKALRGINGAPLPGKVLAVLDADYRLVTDVIPCDDGHASERSLFDDLQQTVEAGDLWIADRNFCTIKMLRSIVEQGACFAIRRHGNLRPQSAGKRKRLKPCKSGTLYEEPVVVGSKDAPLHLRRVEIKLKKPMRDGKKTLEILTNLPKDVSADRVASLYRDRWTIENAFQQIAEALNGEIQTLAYPKAALLGFSLALVSFNLLSVVKTAIAVANDRDVETLSSYYLCQEIHMNYGGMLVILKPEFWRPKFADLNAKQMARELLRMAKHVPNHRFQKTKTRPKGPPKNTEHKTNRPHISTKRVLEEAAC